MANEPVKPSKKQPTNATKDSSEALIFTPISLARARHASQQLPTIGSGSKTGNVDKSSTSGSSKSTKNSPSQSVGLLGLTAQSGGCIIVTLLGLAFAIGGVMGGVVGGGMLLWFNSPGPDSAAVASSTAPTPTSSPTAVPVEKPSPTPTSSPANTPSPSDVIESIFPSVVTVINQQHYEVAQRFEDGRVVGSGVVIDSRGYIATNNHVVDHPGELKVVLSDGRETIAQLVAANPAEDLAILKVDFTDLPAIEWGNSRVVRPGQVVYAIGSPLGDFPNSVSFGIVSGLNRALEIDAFVIDGLIQTDAAINRGSSGGPLIMPDGKVIGINTFIIRESEERGIAEGIAFSIPAETAKNLLIPWIAAHTGESVPIPASEGAD